MLYVTTVERSDQIFKSPSQQPCLNFVSASLPTCLLWAGDNSLLAAPVRALLSCIDQSKDSVHVTWPAADQSEHSSLWSPWPSHTQIRVYCTTSPSLLIIVRVEGIELNALDWIYLNPFLFVICWVRCQVHSNISSRWWSHEGRNY